MKWIFDDDTEIYYSDMRNFGTLKFYFGIGSSKELNKKLSEIGPDMLNEPCDEKTWLKICEKRKNQSLVKFLMEQKNVSGVGNIYKSESLFLAGFYLDVHNNNEGNSTCYAYVSWYCRHQKMRCIDVFL